MARPTSAQKLALTHPNRYPEHHVPVHPAWRIELGLVNQPGRTKKLLFAVIERRRPPRKLD
jgi:hypothetical protein